jgi:hypothetical protein
MDVRSSPSGQDPSPVSDPSSASSRTVRSREDESPDEDRLLRLSDDEFSGLKLGRMDDFIQPRHWSLLEGEIES